MENDPEKLIETFSGAPFFLTEGQCAEIRETIRTMPVERKIPQLFCVLGSVYSDEELRDLTVHTGVGAVLFRPDETETINRRRAAAGQGEIPLLYAANLEEGGAGAISDGTYYGPQMEIAATGDPAECRRFACVCAEEAKRAGVNWTFSPVSDIDFNFRNPITNVRTFGSDPETVKTFAAEYVREVQSRGIAACAKHFPGDGVDYRDQHLHPAVNSLSAAEWEETYGAVYRELIRNNLLSIMAGHIRQPAVEMEMDPSLSYRECMPGSLSKPLLTGLLRGRYGFNGVIVSDATIMGGFTMAMSRRDAIPAAVAAGCDMLVFSTDIREDIRYLTEGVDRGIVSRERIDCALARVLALKKTVCTGDKPAPPADFSPGTWAEECADRAVTLVKDRGGILPLSPAKTPDVRIVVLGRPIFGNLDLYAEAAAFLEKRGFRTELYRRETDDMHGTADLKPTRLTLYLANEPTESNRTTVRLSWNPRHALDAPRHRFEEPHVFVSLYNPYHLQDVPSVPVYVNAYAPTAACLTAALAKLCGESPFRGKSPSDPFCGLEDTKY